MEINSNTVETEVITGVKGYSWCINNSEYADADKVIGI